MQHPNLLTAIVIVMRNRKRRARKGSGSEGTANIKLQSAARGLGVDPSLQISCSECRLSSKQTLALTLDTCLINVAISRSCLGEFGSERLSKCSPPQVAIGS